MSATFPLYAQIRGRRCLVVGGGPVAERKVQDLLDAGAEVLLVSPEVTPKLHTQADEGGIVWLRERYAAHHMESVWLVFAATNVRAVNAAVCADATERRLFVNVADAPDEGTFLVPTVVRRGKLCLSVSTGGANPILARRIAQELATTYGEDYADLVELLGEMRAYTKESTKESSNSESSNRESSKRRAALTRLVAHEAELRRLLRASDHEGARALALQIINSELISELISELNAELTAEDTARS